MPLNLTCRLIIKSRQKFHLTKILTILYKAAFSTRTYLPYLPDKGHRMNPEPKSFGTTNNKR